MIIKLNDEKILTITNRLSKWTELSLIYSICNGKEQEKVCFFFFSFSKVNKLKYYYYWRWFYHDNLLMKVNFMIMLLSERVFKIKITKTKGWNRLASLL